MNQVGSVHTAHAEDTVVGGMSAQVSNKESAKWNAHYVFECRTPEGELVWHEEFDNLITTVGKNYILDSALKTGVSSPVIYIGLKGTGTALAADTMSSHSSWTEEQTYSESVRQTWTPGAVAAGSVSNSGSLATFTANGLTSFYGAFLTTNSTKGGTTGTLISAGDFGTAQPVISGNIVTGQVTVSLT